MPTVIVPLADGFEEIEAIAPIDTLRRAGFDVTTVALAGRGATGAHDVRVDADCAWEEVASGTPDLLVLPGGLPGAATLGGHDGLKAMAWRVNGAGGILAAICAAPVFTLGAWGLLAGRRATCFPSCQEKFPLDAAFVAEPVVVDGRLVTARGAGVALAFAFAIVRLTKGHDAADALQRQMQV